MVKQILFFVIFFVVISCATSTKNLSANKITNHVNDTVRIANDSLEYEVIIIDPGFNSWLSLSARPRQYYSQSFMEMRNKFWTQEWNNRTLYPSQYNSQLYLMPIDYQSGIDYGYEVNYLLFNYLTYFQITNKQQLGSFSARI